MFILLFVLVIYVIKSVTARMAPSTREFPLTLQRKCSPPDVIMDRPGMVLLALVQDFLRIGIMERQIGQRLGIAITTTVKQIQLADLQVLMLALPMPRLRFVKT